MTIRESQTTELKTGDTGTWSDSTNNCTITSESEYTTITSNSEEEGTGRCAYRLWYSIDPVTFFNGEVQYRFSNHNWTPDQLVDFTRTAVFVRSIGDGDAYAATLDIIEYSSSTGYITVQLTIRRGTIIEILYGGGNQLAASDEIQVLYSDIADDFILAPSADASKLAPDAEAGMFGGGLYGAGLGQDYESWAGLSLFVQQCNYGVQLIGKLVCNNSNVGTIGDELIALELIDKNSDQWLDDPGYWGYGVGVTNIDQTVTTTAEQRGYFAGGYSHDRELHDVLSGDAPMVIAKTYRSTGGEQHIAQTDIAWLNSDTDPGDIKGRVGSFGSLTRQYSEGPIERPEITIKLNDADGEYLSSVGELYYEGHYCYLYGVDISGRQKFIDRSQIALLRAAHLPSVNGDNVELLYRFWDPYGCFSVRNTDHEDLGLPKINDDFYPLIELNLSRNEDAIDKVIPVIFGEHYKIGGAIECIRLGWLISDEDEKKYLVYIVSAKSEETGMLAYAASEVIDYWIKAKGENDFTRIENTDEITVNNNVRNGIAVTELYISENYAAVLGITEEGKINVNVNGHPITSYDTMIENPIAIIETLLKFYSDYYFSSLDITYNQWVDIDITDALKDRLDEYGISVAGIIKESRELMELVGEICEACQIRPYLTSDG